jgi:anti-sigma factor RsiW
MSHLDEGLLMALLDGELAGPEKHEAEQHLRACEECAARFRDLKGVMAEADGLVTGLEVPPASPAGQRVPPVATPRGARWPSPRALAWAASIVAALGLGYWGSTLGPSRRDAASVALHDTAPFSSPSEPEGAEAVPASPPPAAAGSGGAVAARGPADEADREQARLDAAGNEALALRPGANEPGPPAAGAARAEQEDTGGLAAAAAAKMAEAARSRDASAERQLVQADRAPLPALPRAEQPGARQQAASTPVFRATTMEDAVRNLSGAIRLIDGLTPEQFEVAAGDSAQAVVRVLYRVGAAESRLFLIQRRAVNSFVASDLQAQAGVRGTVEPSNVLSWNDLQGFSLTLSGPFSVDSLFHFKTLVK